MGWKWNDIAQPLQDADGFTNEQISLVSDLVTIKKWELVAVLEGLAAAEDVEPSHGHPTDAYRKGRASAFREVRDGVMPKGPRPK